MKVKFIGATETVTGSKYFLKNQHKLLIDCGLFQGPNAQEYNSKIESQLDARSIDAVILTHAHLDHCGYLPKLIADGFHGPIFTTATTRALANIIMEDNANIQNQNVKEHNKKHPKHKIKPLYSKTEVYRTNNFFNIVEHDKEYSFKEFKFTFRSVGHIPGASSVIITSENKSITFSGDIGRNDDLLMPAPIPAPKCDYLVMEATYGDRLHTKIDENLMASALKKAKDNRATVLVPAFSVGRSQTMMFAIYDLMSKYPELDMPFFADSPMTKKVTELYAQNPEIHTLSAEKFKEILEKVYFVEFPKQREKMHNTFPKIILTASGMLSGGHIIEHLKNYASDPKNYLFITGFQSPDTPGAAILSGEPMVVLGEEKVYIECQVVNLPFYSSHADQSQLIQWAKSSEARKIFITHGETEAKKVLASELKAQCGFEAHIVSGQDWTEL